MTIKEFIKKRKYLIWYTEDFDNISEEAIVEATLNYGDWCDVEKLISILGIKKTAKIFYKQTKQKRCNYRAKTKNYFKLYFNEHA